jgi:hypothetical protein
MIIFQTLHMNFKNKYLKLCLSCCTFGNGKKSQSFMKVNKLDVLK